MSEASTIILRPAAPGDAAALGRLGALLVAVHHGFDPARFIAPGPGTEQGYGRFLAAELARSEVLVLVAERQGEVLGYVYAQLEGNDWMSLRGPAGVIHDLIVDPDHRGTGLGRRLLEEALRRLRERGAPRVLLSSAKQNEAAQRLFAAFGFRPTMVEMTREWPD